MLRGKRICLVVAVLLFGLAGGISVTYGTTVTLGANALTDLLGPTPVALGASVMNTPMSSGALSTEVLSRAYTDGAGLYAYLYQVDNDLPASNAFVELFSLAPFYGVTEAVEMGYLTGTIPSGFISGGQVPYADGNVNVPVGPTLSFYYLDVLGFSIMAGEHSLVMYVVSDMSPDEIQGNVINGDVASGPVIGPVPEPATILLLGIGGILLRRRRG